MDRFAAMVVLLGVLGSLLLLVLAFFAVAPVFCSCAVSLIYTLYLFMAYEEHGIHRAQEFENRFWTIFAVLCSTALFFAKDSPINFGNWSPSLGFGGVVLSGYLMHLWDRYVHRVAISHQPLARRTSTSSMLKLAGGDLVVEEQLKSINDRLREIDQLLIPSTINNFINQRFVLRTEREIISILQECDDKSLNYLIGHAKLGLLFYKIKDHRNIYSGQHRSELIQLVAVDRLPVLNIMSRVIVLHALQLLKLRANPRTEFWVRNILLHTHQEDLSQLKTLTDAKGDYFCMKKLVYDDIKSETVRQDILNHFAKEAKLQKTHMQMNTRRGRKWQQIMAWRKVLSDVDDTLLCSGGSYPSGIDKRFGKKTVYPGVLAFYRELDLGTQGPEEWPDHRVGNLVFLSARPHVYKDMSERANFAKFEKLRLVGDDGRKGMHTVPSLLAGDLASGSSYIVRNDFEPLAKKKFDNFKRYVSLYPEYKHVFVCDNGQGDVRAGEMMFDEFPAELEAVFVHVVQDVTKTHGYNLPQWKKKRFSPCFFRTYPEAALQAAKRNPPMIRIAGLRRVCQDAVQDFHAITTKKLWPSLKHRKNRRDELNQAIWAANQFLLLHGYEPVELIRAERRWENGQQVRTPYGIATIRDFDSEFDLYEVELDWRPLDVQVAESQAKQKTAAIKQRPRSGSGGGTQLATVVETEEVDDDNNDGVEKLNKETREEAKENSQEQGSPRSESSPRSDASETSSTQEDLSDLSVDTSVRTDGSFDGSDTGSECKETKPKFDTKSVVVARINSRDIHKYSPPKLPVMDKTRTSIFSFWTGGALASGQQALKEGTRCTTPYGPGTIVEYREASGIVEVDMIGWNARAHLQESNVMVKQQGRLFGSLFRRGPATADPTPVKLDFPYAEGVVIQTPFGEGSVVKPLPVSTKSKTTDNLQRTIGIQLTGWTLANDTHPVVFCTVAKAREWKDRKDDGGSLLSAFTQTLVSSSKKVLKRFGSQKPKVDAIAKVERYYLDGASVATMFGAGRVLGFREEDGFYEVSLVDWKLTGGSCPTAYIRKEGISYRIAKGCQEGYPVLTNMGLSGTLASVQPTTGIHIVTVPSAGMVCYLQPDSVIRPLKAAVGEEVLTAYGPGKLERYRLYDDIYIIQLTNWNARLYATAEMFDRVWDGVQDSDAPFGMKWLLGFLFSSSSNKTEGRSRSNSVVSASHRSQGDWSTTQ